MPDGLPHGKVDPAANRDLTRPDRPALVAFVTDAATEAALRDGLQERVGHVLEVRRGGLRSAIAAMTQQATPLVLIVDISGEDMPLSALARLSEVVEPDVCVLVIGESSDLAIYRDITRGMGAAEYIAKPLTRDLVGRLFGPQIRGQSGNAPRETGGKLVTVSGAVGGVGASVIAANLAMYLGGAARRHTVLLDGDLHSGTQAFLMNAEPGPGLRAALESPERIDALLAERAARPLQERLHLLAGQESLGQEITIVPGAGERLITALRKRYNFIIADTPSLPTALIRDLHAEAGQRIVVLTPTLPAVRGAVRVLAAQDGKRQRAVVVLNRLGMPGSLKRSQVEEALGTGIDVVISDLPKPVLHAVTMGESLLPVCKPFATAIETIVGQIGAINSEVVDEARSSKRVVRRWWNVR